MKNLSTEDYATIIADSITNGQRKQAMAQFKDALRDHCNARSLAEDIAGQGIDTSEVFTLLCMIIEGSK